MSEIVRQDLLVLCRMRGVRGVRMREKKFLYWLERARTCVHRMRECIFECMRACIFECVYACGYGAYA